MRGFESAPINGFPVVVSCAACPKVLCSDLGEKRRGMGVGDDGNRPAHKADFLCSDGILCMLAGNAPVPLVNIGPVGTAPAGMGKRPRNWLSVPCFFCLIHIA